MSDENKKGKFLAEIGTELIEPVQLQDSYATRIYLGDKSDSNYVAAVDDSGGIEPLVNEFGSFKSGDHPLNVVGCVLLRQDLLPEFNERWNNLRSNIQRDLGCGHLPAIHLRLMYGRNLRKEHRKRPNPYLHADFHEQIIPWLTEAFSILHWAAGHKRGFAYLALTNHRAEAAQSLMRYYKDLYYRAEMMFIRAHSTGLYKNMYSRYHKKLASSLLAPFTQSLGYLNEYMYMAGNKKVELLVDPFQDSAGIDTAEILLAMNNLCTLEYINLITRVEDPDNIPLCQAADLISFFMFRMKMIQARHIKLDPIALSLMQRLPIEQGFFELRKVRGNLYWRNPDWRHYAHAIHYALARQEVVTVYPAFAKQHLITTQVFLERVLASKHNKVTGTSILNDHSVCEGIKVLK